MWAFRRRFLIVLFIFCVVTVPVFYLSYQGFFKEPTCADGIKNGTEKGVDCGGACQLVCRESITPVSLQWVHYFKNDNGSYDVGMMLHNPNLKTSPEYVAVSLNVSSVNGSVLYASQATTSVPVGSDIPLVIQNIYFRDFPAKATASLLEGRSFSTAKDRSEDVDIKVLSNQREGVSVPVVVTNNTDQLLLRAPLRVVAYGADMRPIAVTETKIDRISPHSSVKALAIFGKNFNSDPFTFKAFVSLPSYDSQKR